MTLTLANFRATLQRHPPPSRYWIAYSGGLDSHVLLHLCARFRDSAQNIPGFIVIHVHHGLQNAADAWSAHCAQTCRDLPIPFELIKVDARAKPGESPEEAARSARYQAILSRIADGDVVLTAQHRDDQAETLLLQLLRGAGLAGLAAMPEYAPLGPGFLLRPLLAYPRQALRAYAEEQGLRWIDDPSNDCLDYDRNFLRQRIIPQLEERWPGVKKTLTRTAGHCAEAQQLLGDLSADLCRAALRTDGISLGVERLKSFRKADQRLVLREWLRSGGYRMPSAAVIERIIMEAIPAGPDKMPVVSWREGEVRRYRDGLFLLPPLPSFDTSVIIPWNGAPPLQLPDNNGELSAALTEGPGIALEAWRRGSITVRYRQGGESIRLPGRNGTHEVKKLFQEAGTPPWVRARAPLIYIDGELAAVADLWVCEPFAGKAGVANIAIAWKGSPASVAPASRRIEDQGLMQR